MNILIIGSDNNIDLFINLCKNSKSNNNVYLTSKDGTRRKVDFVYSNYNELVSKAKTFEIDLAILFDNNLISDGIYDLFKENRLNILCANEKWINLENSKITAKKLFQHYSINVPKTVVAPTKFPVVLKYDSAISDKKVFAYSIGQLIEERENFLPWGSNEKIFIEEFLNGDEFEMISLWDGSAMLYLPPTTKSSRKKPEIATLSGIQRERLDVLKAKTNFMFSDEKANFIGFITAHLLWAQNDWYVLDYKMKADCETLDLAIKKTSLDLVYLLESVLYQNLNEIVL